MTLYIIGVGPGDPELITLKGIEKIKSAEVITGWGSVIERFSEYVKGKKVIPLNYKEEAKLLNEVMNLAKDREVAFLNHGDPAVSDYQLLDKLKKLAKEYGVSLEIIPGVSSIIRALQMVERDLTQVIVVTLHVRGEIDYSKLKDLIKTGRDLLIIPEPYPDGVKKIALQFEKEDPILTIMEKLTYPDEKIWKFKCSEIIKGDIKFGDLTIVYVPSVY
ncbi:precorrin-6y C5,15-methyltransferase(decarboxylating), CbiE subunit [Acidianus hospitalis W1]|uniref:Precorrin-6y C5,15-methyltransferase(Decarboxylating), CbiE subunit n=1 Tax=Acidianus hospitalis (strain W1) TaxID=933801 RepID=F4B857_ACIHW|nr:cobalt-precorrin-7 (C(5))-methyltransferase [Acidianus hospitalis]AEE94881.1 precorrin-6y C5,15-methyltransferase(decarboxylating), CbiE subunit [Acidianus hospitalis W1]